MEKFNDLDNIYNEKIEMCKKSRFKEGFKDGYSLALLRMCELDSKEPEQLISEMMRELADMTFFHESTLIQ